MKNINEDISIEDYIDELMGDAWKGMAFAQYQLSMANGKTHQQSMLDVSNKILETADRIIERR